MLVDCRPVRALVVLSHPEPSSFAAALARAAADALGTDVVDLYAEGCDQSSRSNQIWSRSGMPSMTCPSG